MDKKDENSNRYTISNDCLDIEFLYIQPSAGSSFEDVQPEVCYNWSNAWISNSYCYYIIIFFKLMTNILLFIVVVILLLLLISSYIMNVFPLWMATNRIYLGMILMPSFSFSPLMKWTVSPKCKSSTNPSMFSNKKRRIPTDYSSHVFVLVISVILQTLWEVSCCFLSILKF